MVGVLTSFSPPTDGIKHEQPSTKLFVEDREIGSGTLYITESELSWRNDATGEGLSIQYPHIAVHAVSRDIQQFSSECLIVMLDTRLHHLCDIEGNGEESDEEDDAGTEMRFVPEDKTQLDAMYQAMTYCQCLHPDPCSSDGEEFVDANEEEDDDGWGGGDTGINEDHDPTAALNSLRIQNGCNHDAAMDTDAGQFEDAEDD